MRILVAIVALLFFLPSLAQTGSKKMKGISFVASSSPISEVTLEPVIEMNANWVTLMPYGFVGEDGKVQFNSKWQWWGETSEGVIKTIEYCQNKGLKIMLKPQIWMRNAYTGNYTLTTEKEWLTFENSYTDFIFTFAQIAAKMNVDLFCIGTEWREFVKTRQAYWKGLIKTVRDNYQGKLVYAANWDDYETVPFWDDMDYIGVNGYFPISRSEKPTLAELKTGWNIHRKKLAAFSKQYKNNRIILTEIGYRSMDGSTIEPWEHSKSTAYNAEIQTNAYRALFAALWNEPWFEGLFIWKWFHNNAKVGGENNTGFTPQNKPAAAYIRSFWAKN